MCVMLHNFQMSQLHDDDIWDERGGLKSMVATYLDRYTQANFIPGERRRICSFRGPLAWPDDGA